MPDGLVIFNPGSVGCPAYDDPTAPAHVSEQGSPHARYGIVELGEDGACRHGSRRSPSATTTRRRPCVREQSGRPEWAHGLRTGFIRV